jgi:predicted transcriptional regulator of viral defense system
VRYILEPALPTLSSRERLSAVVRRAPDLVTVDDASKALNVDRVTAAKTLARWTRQGWLKRVRRGLYLPVPLATPRDAQVLEDTWSLVPQLFSPGYVGGASAAHHWGLTEQIFRTVFVYTAAPVRQSEQTVQGIRFLVHHLREEHLFGTRPLWRGRVKIQVSDVHRTIIDILDDPASGGGVRHVADCLDAYFQRKDTDHKRLIEYGDKLGNGAIFKRLGFLAERMGGPHDLLTACSERLTQGVAKLDPALPSPRILRRWRLWLPESWKSKAVVTE